MWRDAAAARRHLDRLAGAGRITGWGLECSIAYLAARRPTMSYRMYRGDDAEDLNLGAFIREVASRGAQIAVSEAEGCVAAHHGWRPPGGGFATRGVWRSRQVVLTISFASDRELRFAAQVVAERFTRRVEAGHLPGSWWVPDARVSGTPNCPPGMILAKAFTRRAGRRHAVVLTPGGPAPFSGARTHPVFLPEPFGRFLRG
ncbi:MAG: hypothetical protein M3Y62_09430 [Candidatus Dormibacteraeota bacterium]|nr:hypothetical protein [Candidatus Dormibacteraeota bacterium]